VRPIEIYQGEDVRIDVTINDDISAATEVEFRIDTPVAIKKSLTDGSITNVTTTGYTVQIDAGDTETLRSGPYKMQSRATIAGKIHHIRHTPNKVKVLNSVYTQLGSARDYGARVCE